MVVIFHRWKVKSTLKRFIIIPILDTISSEDISHNKMIKLK